jgi:AcrR family transcriptional regulator
MAIPPPPWRTARPQNRRRAPLTQDRIVDVALDLLRREGYKNVSMRRLAQALGTGPASLYAHVENKRELDQLVVDRVIDPALIPEPDPEHWPGQVKQVMRSMREMYRQNPGVARATMAMIPTGPSGLAAIERMLKLFVAAGVPDQVAAWSADLIALYVCAISYDETLWEDKATQEQQHEYFAQQLRGYFQSLPADQFPTLVALATAMATGDDEDRFEFGIEVIVAGIAALAARPEHASEHASEHALLERAGADGKTT